MGEQDELEREEPGGLVPPYEGRQTEMKDGYEQHVEKVFHGADEVELGPGPTDTEATSALGVGESLTRHGEDVAKQEDEEGREDTGTKGPSDRPTGTSDERDSTSLDPN